MFFPTLLTLALASLSTAAPSLLPRQGGYFVAVGNKYSGPGCVPQSLIFADPIFGYGNACQALDRSGTGVKIVSYSTLSAPGCSGKSCGGIKEKGGRG
jgi:hypothetical protein